VIPNNLGSVAVWTLSDYETISYYLDGAFGSTSTWTLAAREAFREWSGALSDREHHVRFVETTDKASANIVVTNGATYQGGCVDQTRERFCNLTLPTGAYLLKGIGQILGIPASTGAGDVMNAPSTTAIFTAADLNSIGGRYQLVSQKASYHLTPVFNAPYNNASGSEIVIGWDDLRSRSASGSVTVNPSLHKRKLVALALPSNRVSSWDFPRTFGVLTYPLGTSGTGSVFGRWPFLNGDYSVFGPSGMKGSDPAPGILGFPSCSDPSVPPSEGASWTEAPQLFAFDPAEVYLVSPPSGGSPYASAPKWGISAGMTVPVWFYRNPATGTFAVSAGVPTGSVACARLGGYGFAVN